MTKDKSDRPGCTNPECKAKEGGINPDTGRPYLVGWGTQWKCTLCGTKQEKFKRESLIDNSDLERYVHEPRLNGDYLVLFDPHYPLHHTQCHEYAMGMCRKWNITKCVIGGDALDLDCFKNYPDHHPDVASWKVEKTLLRFPLEWLATEFKRVDLILGNHELRMWKRLLGKGDQEDVFDLVLADLKPSLRRRVKYYIYPVAIINNSWIIDHPNMTSVIQGRVPERLSAKYMVKHVMQLVKNGVQPQNEQLGYISGHGHMGGEGQDISGEFQIADGMVTCDPDLFGYHKLKRSARPEWRVGFNIIRNNYLYRFPLKNTDWKFWLNGGS